jgi:hypothetical protein
VNDSTFFGVPTAPIADPLRAAGTFRRESDASRSLPTTPAVSIPIGRLDGYALVSRSFVMAEDVPVPNLVETHAEPLRGFSKRCPSEFPEMPRGREVRPLGECLERSNVGNADHEGTSRKIRDNRKGPHDGAQNARHRRVTRGRRSTMPSKRDIATS